MKRRGVLVPETAVEFAASGLLSDAEGGVQVRAVVPGAQRFAGDGEALLAAYQEGDLVGIGGVTREPSKSAEPALRLRRLFVHPGARRNGAARTIVAALVHEGFDNAPLLTAHAGDARATAFWEAQGFQPVTGRAWSHELRR